MVRNGDIILVKEVGGPVCGLAVASRALFFDLKYEPITRIREEYGSAIGGDDEFWEQSATRRTRHSLISRSLSRSRISPAGSATGAGGWR